VLAHFSRLNFNEPTSMQSDFISKSGDFSILLSNTGSGKTFAFLVRLALELENSVIKNECVLILSPTRELAGQLFQELKKMRLAIPSILCYGGHSVRNEKMQFSSKPQLIISTPGRILDHYERGTEGLLPFTKLIIDEYDKTLELGFLNELAQIFEYRKNLNYLHLISATEIESLPHFLKDYSFVTFNYLKKEELKLSYFTVQAEKNDKLHALALLLTTLETGPTIIFCNHREATERISEHLVQYGKEHVVFHGGLEQEERERAIVKFKNGSVDCILATDLISRGIDIPEVKHIIHYQYPQKLEDYIHRNGRTARMNSEGSIYLIHSENEPLPIYLKGHYFEKIELPNSFQDYIPTKFLTLFLNVGRKHKIRKLDIVGLLTVQFKIPFEEIGQINVYDQFSYIALSKKAFHDYKKEMLNFKIKKINAKISLCR
jgi:superfamily II DNA/RNA helicase